MADIYDTTRTGGASSWKKLYCSLPDDFVPDTVQEFDLFFANKFPSGATSDSERGCHLTYGEVMGEGVATMVDFANEYFAASGANRFSVFRAAASSSADLREGGSSKKNLSSSTVLHQTSVGVSTADKTVLRKNDSVPPPGKVFLDLGSGVGKGPIIALLLANGLLKDSPKRRSFHFSKAIGIELAESRHAIALDAVAELCRSSSRPDYRQTLETKLTLTQGDILEDAIFAIAAADVIWISNLCFPKELNFRLARLLDAFCKVNTLIFVSSRLNLHRGFEVVSDAGLTMAQSWHLGSKVSAYRYGLAGCSNSSPNFVRSSGRRARLGESLFMKWNCS